MSRLQCPFHRPSVNVLYGFIFSRDKTELDELICEEWLQTLLHHAGLISQEAAVANGDKSHVDYEGNGVLYSLVLIDWFTVVLIPYGLDAPRLYRQALCAP
jgi:hypothetical protein